MNLRGIANSVTQIVNPNTVVSLRRSNGYTTGSGAKQEPQYYAAVDVPAQVQALDGKTLEHLAAQNIQGTLRAIYIFGTMQGVVRPTDKGGDLVTGTDLPGFPGSSLWKVERVLEAWPQWTKCAIVLQVPAVAS